MASLPREQCNKLKPYLVLNNQYSQHMLNLFQIGQFLECIRISYFTVTDHLYERKLFRMQVKQGCKKFENPLNRMLKTFYTQYKPIDNASLFAELANELFWAIQINETDYSSRMVSLRVMVDDLISEVHSMPELLSMNFKCIEELDSLDSGLKSMESVVKDLLTDLPSYDEVKYLVDKSQSDLKTEKNWLYAYFK